MNWRNKKRYWIPLAILVTLTSLVIFIFSAPGSRLLLSLAESQVDGLTLDYQRGNLADKLELDHIRFVQGPVDIDITSFSIDVQWSALWQGDIHLNTVSIGELNVTVASVPQEETESNTGANKITMPLPVLVEALHIGPSHINLEAGQLSLESLFARVAFDQRLTIELAQLTTLNWIGAEPEKTDSSSFNPATFHYVGLQLAPIVLPLDWDIQQLQISPILLDSEPVIQDLLLRSSNEKNTILLEKLQLSNTQFEAKLQGQVSLDNQYPMTFDVQATSHLESLPFDQVHSQLEGDLRALTAHIVLNKNGQPVAQLDAEVSPATTHLPFDISALWQDIHAPLWSLEHTQGKLLAKGNLQDFALQLNSSVEPDSFIQTDIGLDLTGSLSAWHVNQLSLDTEAGKVTANGELQGSDAWHWQGKLSVEKLRPEHFLEQPEQAVNGIINGQFNSELTWQSGQWQAALKQIQLNGHLNEQPLQASGAIAIDHTLALQIEDFQLIQGNNQLRLQGQIDQQQQQNLTLSASLNDLSEFLPELQGSFQIDGELSGSLSQPTVDLSLSANRPGWREFHALSAQGNLHWYPQQGDDIGLQLHVQRPASLHHAISEADLSVSGSLENHQIQLNTQGGDAQFDILIDGVLSTEQWHGIWQTGQIRSRYANLDLQTPFSIDANWAQQHYQISAHCWKQKDSQLCVEQAQYAQDAAKWQLRLQKLPIAPLLNRWVTQVPNVQTDSTLSVAAVGQWQKGTLPNTQFEASISPATWQFKPQRKAIELHLDTLLISSNLHDNQGNIALQFASAELGALQLQSQFSGIDEQAALDGLLTIDNLNLSPLQDLLPDVQTLQGTIQGESQLSGTLSKPLLQGTLSMQDGVLALKGLPMQLEQIQQSIELQGQQATLNGEFVLGEGNGRIHGEVSWAEQIEGLIELSGQQLKVAYQRQMEAILSPDLVLQFAPQHMSLTGSLAIPQAHIKIRELPASASSPSSDVVFVDEQTDALPLSQKVELDIHLEVDPEQHEKVFLDAFGLTTHLQGEMRLYQKNQTLSTDGLVQLVNGRYRAYGQNLIIRTGELQFNGPPDQPYVNLEAIRDPDLTQDSVVAGVRLNGSIQQPNISFFSEPGMDDASALSYLLRGSAPDSGGSDQSQDAILTSMLLAVGLGKSENLVGRIGDKLGVDNLALDTSGDGDNTKLNITGYIAPGVQLRYGVGVFNSAAEVALRYELMPKLFVEAVSSGVSTALDLYWRFSLDNDKPSGAASSNPDATVNEPSPPDS